MEVKYRLKNSIFSELLETLKPYLEKNDVAYSTISNVYFDTPDYQMIKDSIDQHFASAKVRIRSYHFQPTNKGRAFLEIKKRHCSDDSEDEITYRLSSNPVSIHNYIKHNLADDTIDDDKIKEELTLLKSRYPQLVPKMHISYKRTILKVTENPHFAIIFEEDILFRNYDVSIVAGRYGQPLLKYQGVLMTLKVSGKLPSWMTNFLDKHQLVPQECSKYATAYLNVASSEDS